MARIKRKNRKSNVVVEPKAVVTPEIIPANVPYAKVAKRDAKGRILPRNTVVTEPVKAEVSAEGNVFQILKLKGKEWKVVATISTTPKGRPLKDENDALRYGHGVFGTRPRMGEATAKSGSRFKAVKVTA